MASAAHRLARVNLPVLLLLALWKAGFFPKLQSIPRAPPQCKLDTRSIRTLEKLLVFFQTRPQNHVSLNALVTASRTSSMLPSFLIKMVVMTAWVPPCLSLHSRIELATFPAFG